MFRQADTARKASGTTEFPRERRSEEIVEKNSHKSGENDGQIIAHHLHQLLRRPQKPDDKVEAGKDQNIQNDRDAGKEGKGGQDAFLKSLFILLSIADGKDGAASHGKPQNNGGQEGHKREGGAHGGQGAFSQIAAHNQSIGDIIALLQQISQNHGDGEAQHSLHDRSFRQFVFHFFSTAFFLKKLT